MNIRLKLELEKRLKEYQANCPHNPSLNCIIGEAIDEFLVRQKSEDVPVGRTLSKEDLLAIEEIIRKCRREKEEKMQGHLTGKQPGKVGISAHWEKPWVADPEFMAQVIVHGETGKKETEK